MSTLKGVEDGEVEASAIHSGVQDRSGEVSIGIATFTVDQGYSFAQAGKQLGVLPKLIQAWAKKYRAGELVSGAPRLRVTAEQQELSRLRQEVQRLKMERDILMAQGHVEKAAAYFATVKVTMPGRASEVRLCSKRVATISVFPGV